MAIVTVIGAGVMGTALTVPLADNGHTVRLVGTRFDTDIIRRCKQDRYHPHLHHSIPEQVTPYNYHEIALAMAHADVILLAVNSQGLEWAADAILPHLQPGMTLLLATKGLKSLDGESLLVPSDVLAEKLPPNIRQQINYAAIGGPSIAAELADRHDTNVVFVSRNGAILPQLQAVFQTNYYHVFTSTDMIGVEVCVALKNPYAIAAGLAVGMGGAGSQNRVASVFAQGLTEMAHLVQVLGGDVETVFTLPGAGDLFVTTQAGRNARFGRLLGSGLPYEQALAEMPSSTIEGVEAIRTIGPVLEKMIAEGRVDPTRVALFRALHEIVVNEDLADFDFSRFFTDQTRNHSR